MVFTPRPADYRAGDGHLTGTPRTNADWTPFLEFFESQLIKGQDSDGCVLFTAQEDFDAQVEQQIQSGAISGETVAWFAANGYMDTGLDGKPHFHTSPRFLQILTGNGFNGNSVQDGWDMMRLHGCLPWIDLPVDMTLTAAEYLAPLTQTQLDKGIQFLAAIGGKPSISYQWVCDGAENLESMLNALPQAPLCLGVVTDNGWNQFYPTPPPNGTDPNHCVMEYKQSGNDVSIYDHYTPAKKELVNYPVLYAFQGIVTVTPPPPAPTLPPTVTPTTATPSQIAVLLRALSTWLSHIANGLEGKVETSNNNMQISAFEQAALHVCKVAAWVIGSAAIPALLTLYTGNAYWLALTPLINGIGAGLVKWSGIQATAAMQAAAANAAAAAKQPSAQ